MPKVVNKDQKKKQILNAALMVYSEKGVKNSRIIDIAHKAGIGKGTVYEYFRSQDEILVASFYMLMENMESEITGSMENITDPVEQISAMIKIPFLKFAHLSYEYMAIFIEYWTEGIRGQDENNELAISFKNTYRNFRRQMVDIINKGIKQRKFRRVNAVSVASTLMAIVDGLYLQMMLDKNAFPHSKIIDHAIDMVFNGILIDSK